MISFRMLRMPGVLLMGDSPTDPLAPMDVNSDPIFNHEEIPDQDWGKVSVAQQLGDAMEEIASVELQTKYEGREGDVEDTTNPPTDVVVVPIRGDTLKDHRSDDVWYGGRAGDTAVSPIVVSDVGMGRGETGDTVFSSIMLSEID